MRIKQGLLLCILCVGQLFAQPPMGSMRLVNQSLIFANGNQAYSFGPQGGKYVATCIQIEKKNITQAEISFAKKAFSSSFICMGKNNIYLVQQSSSKSKNGLFDDLRITCWDGQNAPQEYDFPGYLDGAVIRYAIADDEQIYFLTDQQLSGFSETEVYQCKHNLLRFTKADYFLRKINYGLSIQEDSPFTSFWFPLRIENSFTEWYRAKYKDKRIVFEVQKLNTNGNNLSSTEVSCDLSPGIIPNNSFTPSGESNMYHNSEAFFKMDTIVKVQATSMLTLALLQYNAFNHEYFTTFKIYAEDAIGREGFYLMTLDSNLNIIHRFENYEIIKNPTLTALLPDFSKTDYKVMFNNQGNMFLNIEYRNYVNKIVGTKSYEWKENNWVEVVTKLDFDRLKGFYYPGFGVDEKCRSLLQGVKPNLKNTPVALFNGKYMLYVFPTIDKNNVFSVQVE
jgi:hypothetical protein